MKSIKLTEHIKISKCKGDLQNCSYCKEKIKRGGFGLLITKPHLPNFNVWIHFNCIDKFAKDIMKFKKKHIRDIMIESLTEKRK